MNMKKQAIYFKNEQSELNKKDYIFLKEYKKDLTEQDVEKVCESLLDNEKEYSWTYSNIRRDTGVDIKLIKDIERKKKYKNISEKYNLEDPYKYSKILTTNEIKSLCFHYEMEPVFGDSLKERRDNCIEGLKFAANINKPSEEQIREGLLIFNRDICSEITDKYCYKYDPVYKNCNNN